MVEGRRIERENGGICAPTTYVEPAGGTRRRKACRRNMLRRRAEGGGAS
jgi:hypothetical protein